MPNPVPMPDGFESAIARYLAFECSTVDLAREFGRARETVVKWMEDAGVKRHHPHAASAAKLRGKPGNSLGVKRSAETRAKLSAIMRARPPTTLGYKFSDESKEKMRKSARERAIREGKTLREHKPKKQPKAAMPKAIRQPRVLLSLEEKVAREKARGACKRMVRRILTMARVKKDRRRSELLLGYTKHELRKHLEAQFTDGMGWDKRDSFHIDHIKPVAAFFREGVYDPAVINALSNLQVLTPQANKSKSDKWEFA